MIFLFVRLISRVSKSTGQQVNRSAWPTVEASNKSQVTIKLDHTEVNQLTIHLEACENHNKGPFLLFFFNKQR